MTRPTATFQMPEKSFLPRHSEVPEKSQVSNPNDNFSSDRSMQDEPNKSLGSAIFLAPKDCREIMRMKPNPQREFSEKTQMMMPSKQIQMLATVDQESKRPKKKNELTVLKKLLKMMEATKDYADRQSDFLPDDERRQDVVRILSESFSRMQDVAERAERK